MLFDAIERAVSVVNTNFQTDWNSLAGLKGVSTTGFVVTIVKRESAVNMIENGLAKPCIGIYGLGGVTQMAQGGLGGMRNALSEVIAELVNVGTDPELIQRQVELGLEVLVKCLCERITNGPTLTFGGGVELGSVRYEITDAYKNQQAPNWICVGTVTVPVWDRDQTT